VDVHALTSLLRDITATEADVPELVKAFAAAYWQADGRGEIPEGDERWTLLGDLALDLEYYEPNPVWRVEEPCYYDDAEAVRRVSEALVQLASSR